jgi:hypothetical protein
MNPKNLKSILTAGVIFLCATTFAQDYSGGSGGSGNSDPCWPGATSWYLGGNTIVPPAMWNPNGPMCATCPQPLYDAGTCNNWPFVLKANNLPSVFIMQNARVGIGMNNGNPGAQLDVRKIDIVNDPNLLDMSNFRIYANAAGDLESTTDITMNFASGKNMFFKEGVAGNTSAPTWMTINSGGEVGVGGPGGGAKLTVDASTTSGNGLNVVTNNTGYAFAIHNNTGGVHAVWNDGRVAIGNTGQSDPARLNVNMTSAGQAINVFDIGSGKTNFRVDNNGKTIVGNKTQNTSGNHANALMTVNGKIVGTEVVVTQINWSDFVFDKNYKLRPLADVESFYKQNHHLPEVPSAAEVAENGNDLGKTDALLLQKIEELTLYLVDQNKLIQDQRKEISDLKKQVQEIKTGK